MFGATSTKVKRAIRKGAKRQEKQNEAMPFLNPSTVSLEKWLEKLLTGRQFSDRTFVLSVSFSDRTFVLGVSFSDRTFVLGVSFSDRTFVSGRTFFQKSY